MKDHVVAVSGPLYLTLDLRALEDDTGSYLYLIVLAIIGASRSIGYFQRARDDA